MGEAKRRKLAGTYPAKTKPTLAEQIARTKARRFSKNERESRHYKPLEKHGK